MDHDDLRTIRQKTRQLNSDSLASSQRSVQLLLQSETTAASTLHRLDQQSDVLNTVSDALESTEQNADKAREKADEIKRFNRSIFLPTWGFKLNKKKKPKESLKAEKIQVKATRDAAGNSGQRVRFEGKERAASAESGNENDENNVKEQIDRNLDVMSGSLKRLQMMGMQMKETTQRQNEVLNGISQRTDGLDSQVRSTTERLKKL